MFKAAAKALARPGDEPQPEPRRKSGDTGKGHVIAWRRVLQRGARKTGAAARGRYAALQPEKASPPSAADPFATAAAYLSDTLDWLRLWEANSTDFSDALDDSFDTQQDHNFPQP